MPDALSWLGMRIDDAYGARVGDVEDVFLEADGSPRWIFTRPARVLIPAGEAMAGAGRVWVPYEKDLIKRAPAVASLDGLTPELEAATWRWFAHSGGRAGWVAHGRRSMPWVNGYSAERQPVGEQPPVEPRAEQPLPPLRTPPPPQPEPAYADAADDGRSVVMVFNIGCDDGARRAAPAPRPRRAADDDWQQAAMRALEEYARRSGSG